MNILGNFNKFKENINNNSILVAISVIQLFTSDQKYHDIVVICVFRLRLSWCIHKRVK